MSGNNIIDKTNDELSKANIFENLDGQEKIIEQGINDQVEKSFQVFLEENNASVSDIDNNIEKKRYENDFNERLDKDASRILETFKDLEKEGAEQEAKNALYKLKFQIDLANLQKQISDEKDNTEVEEVVKLGEDDIVVHLYSGLDKKKSEVVHVLNDNNFERKREIIKYFKDGKVDKIQMILKDAGYTDQLGTYGDNKDGVDNRFGKKTFDALKEYIKDKKLTNGVDDHSDSDVVGEAALSSTGIEAVGVGVDNDGNVVDVNGNTVPADTEFSPEQKEELSKQYGFKEQYDVKNGKKIDLGLDKNIPDGFSVETFPKTSGFEIKKGELFYTSDTDEETFTLKLLNDKGVVVVEKTIVMGEFVDSDIDNDAIEKIDKVYKEFNNFVAGLSGSIDNKINEIGKKIDSLRNDYDKKETDLSRKLDIQTLIDLLLERQERLYLKKQISRVASGNDKAAKERLLNDKFKDDNYIVNIGGKDLSAEKFLDLLGRGKIGEYYIVDLDIKLDYHYYDKDYKDNRNYNITNLVISDDPNYGANERLTRDQEIQYKSEGYGKLEKGDTDIKNDRQAIKNILGIRGLFGMGGVDKNMSIASVDYNTNNPVLNERHDLRTLKKVLMAFVSEEGDMVNIRDAFQKIAEIYSKSSNGKVDWKHQSRGNLENLDDNGFWRRPDDKQLMRLGRLYSKYMKKQGGDYFNRVMGMLDNYFVRGRNDFANDSKTFDAIESNKGSMFQDMYKSENMGRVSGLIDPDKKRQAIKSIFKKGYEKGDIGNIDLGEGIKFKDTKQLKELKKITKKVDLVELFDRINLADGDSPYNMTKWEEKFYNQYIVYKEKLSSKDGLDDNGHPIVEEGDDYYNAVFDFLVGIGEGRQNIVEAVNGVNVMSNIDNYDELSSVESKWYDSSEEKQFVMLLSDLNFDGRTDFGDRGLRMGLEIKDIYKSVKVDEKHLKTGGDTTWKNIISFTKKMLEKNGQDNLLSDLEGKGGDLGSLINEFKSNPGLLKYMQSTLVDSSMPVEYILRYGDKATEQYFMPQMLSNNVEIKGLDEVFNREYNRLLEQGFKDTPELRTMLKPIVYGALLRSGGISYGYGGVGLELNTEKAGTFRMSMGYGDVPGVGVNGSTSGVLGVFVGWGKSFNLSKKTSLSVGVDAGSTANYVFVPVLSGHVGIKTMINENQLDKNLKPKSAKYFDASANVSMIGTMPTWGLGVGFSQDKLAGLNKQYENIKDELAGRHGILKDLLVNINLRDDVQNVVPEIQNRLTDAFGKSDPDELRTAALNIYRGLSYYTRSVDGPLEENDPRLKAIVHDMTENYALQWKNEAMRGIKGVHVNSVMIGIQFLAKFIPSPIGFASYKNLYSSETDESIANYYAQLSTGRGMNRVESIDKDKSFVDDNGNITQEALDYLNDKMSIAHPDIDIPDLEIKKGPISNAPKTSGETGFNLKALYLPLKLYRYANINISSDLRNNIKSDNINGVDYIVAPLNAQVSLLDYSRTNSARFNLIIGDTKAEMDDIQVNPGMDKFVGDPLSFESNESSYMSADDINNKINQLKEIEIKDKDGNVKEVVKHPLGVCNKLDSGDISFDIKQDMIDKCIDMGGTKSVLDIENGKIVMPQFGTLSMRYRSIGKNKGKYEMYYSSNPSDGLNVMFDVEGYSKRTSHYVEDGTITVIDDNGAATEISGLWDVVEGGFDSNDIYANISRDVDALFGDDIVKNLRKLDEGGGGLEFLKKFLSYSSRDIDTDNENNIDKEEYEKASEALISRFGGKFGDIKNFLENKNVSDEKKSLVINRIKGIMAFDEKVHTGKGLYSVYESRKEAYKKLFGSSGKKIGDKIETYRDDLFGDLKNDGNLSDDVEKNLFGYTAFYRKGTAEGRNFSMTAPGDTKVLGGKMRKIDDSDAGTQEWFMDNFEKNTITQKVVFESLVNSLDKQNIHLNEKMRDKIEGNLIDLMRNNGKYLNIELDGKKYKVKLDMDYYFYLLGECGNESVGVKMGGLDIRHEFVDNGEGQGSTHTKPDGGYEYDDVTFEGGSDSVYIGHKSEYMKGGLYANTVESKNELAWAKKPGLKTVGAVGVRDVEDIPDDPEQGTGKLPDPPPDPNQGTGKK